MEKFENYLKESSDDREGSVDKDPGLSNNEEEVVQLQPVGLVVAEPPHLPHGHHHRQTGQAVDRQLGERGHLDSELPQSELLVTDENEENDETDDGDHEDDNPAE